MRHVWHAPRCIRVPAEATKRHVRIETLRADLFCFDHACLCRGGWQEDCHADVLHSFVDALTAVPAWQDKGVDPRLTT